MNARDIGQIARRSLHRRPAPKSAHNLAKTRHRLPPRRDTHARIDPRQAGTWDFSLTTLNPAVSQAFRPFPETLILKNIGPTLATVWRIAAPYFRSEDKWAGRALLAAVIAAELAIVGLTVLQNHWNARFFNALQERNWDTSSGKSSISACLRLFSRSSRSTSSTSINGCRSAGGAG